MDESAKDHKCLFCPQAFDSASDKDDHILEHFTHETCTNCNQNLIRIGELLYIRHDEVTCIKTVTRSEKNGEVDNASEPQLLVEMRSESLEYDEGGAAAKRSKAIAVEKMELPAIKREPDDQHSISAMGRTSSINISEIHTRFRNVNLSPVVVLDDILKKANTRPPTESASSEHIESESNIHLNQSSNHSNNNATIHYENNRYPCRSRKQIFASNEQFRSYLSDCNENQKTCEKQSASKTFECFVCHKNLQNRRSVIWHLRTNHKERFQRFVCSICGKAFDTNSQLKIHEFIHAGQKPYKCKYEGCEEVFKNYKLRDRHFETHPNINEKLYHCKIDGCSKRFSIDWNLRVHRVNAHGLYLFKLKCTVCSKAFDKKNELLDHMQTEHPNHDATKKLSKSQQKPAPECEQIEKLVDSSEKLPYHQTRKNKEANRNEQMEHNVIDNNTRNYTSSSDYEPSDDEPLLQKNICKEELHIDADPQQEFDDENIIQSTANNEPNESNKDARLPIESQSNLVLPIDQNHQSYILATPEEMESIRHACDICPKVLTTLSAKIVHKMVFHSESGVFACNKCNKSFLTLYHLRTHRKNGLCLTEKKVYKCETCGLSFVKKSEFNRHSKKCKHVCRRCWDSFKTKAALKRHFKLMHTDTNQFKCRICMEVFNVREQLVEHMHIKHEQDVESTNQKKDKLSQGQYEIKVNRSPIEPQPHDEEKQKVDCHKCNICGEVFLWKTSLESHIKRDHNNSGEFPCNICRKSFSTRRNFQSHNRRIHNSKYKKFKCEICGYLSTVKAFIRMHIEAVHLQIEKYKCDICKKGFTRKQVLTDHMRIHSGERPYKCSYCSKRLRTHWHKIQHERCHNDEKPFVCEIEGCDKAFKGAHNLKIHRQRHHGITFSYSCKICKEVFDNKMKLIKHTQETH